ncbi:hypothetical protein L202_00160 [Cryptococcus amylolentus CBS 6039]|uniref:Mannosyltransferase n=2 Tax=Cryptococcus amylolentus TaxID=104669 RepID=A0A1E3I8J0_9TREE|nr:hypothetical protein L202_00160 [Cryptococcus amylolentus CBS 6039]ODN84156.1 hypothetical protein L202_00160 [Cryptococcus amylolentus CBS 6039]ODO11983.1 hypothetical protein I350_00767 [Cryptococcus amylolentus CBS 6273]
MPPYALITPFLIRALLHLPFPQTFFQPDEFYQALEPAHQKVFGYGFLSWEWTDLPRRAVKAAVGLGGQGVMEKWWDETVVGGRMRGWIWPGLFTGAYKILQSVGLDQGVMLTLAPRIVGVVVAGLTDYYTYRLSSKMLGHGSAPTALFLSLTSLFNAHLLPRALSTSPETLLTLMAIYYFPLPHPVPTHIEDLKRGARLIPVGNRGKSAKEADEAEMEILGVEDSDATFWGVNELDYVVMDRTGPAVERWPVHKDTLALSIGLAALAICVRPTMLSFWAFLGINLLYRSFRSKGLLSAIKSAVVAFLSFVSVFSAATGFDYYMTGRLYFPLLTFIHQNLFLDISSFYGRTTPLYHLTQSLPLMLFPIWIWWAKGFAAALLPSSILPASLSKYDRQEGMTILARAITFTITTLSLSSHSEWRFLHPLLPPLLLFAIPSFSLSYTPTILGAYFPVRSFRQYLRMDKVPFYTVLFAGVVPFVYLNVWHGAAQVGVMDVLRSGKLGEVQGLVVLGPCHSVPWMSHLHEDVPAWFLTCEPPVGVDASTYQTEQELFYADPVGYLYSTFPALPSSNALTNLTSYPSHVILFGELLSRSGFLLKDEPDDSGLQMKQSTVEQAFEMLGYEQVWEGWNGFDLAQDEDERKGGVRVWRKE